MSTETLDNIWRSSPPKQPNTSAEQRARLIREMAGSKRSRSSLDSGSVREDDDLPRGTGWDTNSHQLPTSRPEPNFQINTSALKRAFPDFSQHGSSTEDSIEVGRGYKNSVRNTPNGRPPSEDLSASLHFDFNGAKYKLNGTPPMRPRTSLDAKSQTSVARAASNKENQPPKETRNISASSGKGSFDSRKTLVERHPTVESDDSVLVDEQKSAPANRPMRSTRFASGHSKDNYHTPATSKQQLHAMQNTTHTSNLGDAPVTNQSYIIPDMPNITELITGHRQDGTPIFNRSAKSRSRFNTPSNRRASIRATHVPVENMPVPADTKALYVSLQLLQEKVADLESTKEQSEQKLEEYELEVLQLRSELEARDHAKNDIDSGIEADAEDGKIKNLESEKSKLEASLRALQDRLDRANRKINKSEGHVTNLTKDRDALHAQLGLAYLHTQDDDESRALTDQVKQLRTELARVTSDHQKQIARLTKQGVELRGKIERREKAINGMASLAKELYSTRTAIAADSRPDLTQHPVHDPSLRIDKLRQPVQTHQRSASGMGQMRPRSTSRRASSRQDRRQQMRTDHFDANDSEADAAASDVESTTHIRVRQNTRHSDGLAKDADFMSFMDGDEVEKLRFVVEDERAKMTELGLEVQPTQEKMNLGNSPSKKASMKTVSYADLTDRSIPASEKDNTTRFTQQRQDTQQSVASQTSERRRRSAALRTDDTSAFLVPDVTLRQDQRANQVEEEVLRQTVKIARPTPVSDRMPIEEDATVRPAQDPALALATVISDLEAETSQLRSELIVQEALYNQHDPSLSKRKRKIVFTRIQKLLAAIETRADQIYALYDVLEGQKASGQMMKEDEVEVTLQNIGLDPGATLGKKQDRKPAVEDVGESLASDVEDSEDDFPPWDGLEATQTQTLDHLPRISVR